MRSFKKFRDYALQSHNKSKEKGGGNHDHYHLHPPATAALQQPVVQQQPPSSELDEVSRGLQVVQGMQHQYAGLVAVSSQVSSCAYDLSVAVEGMATYLINSFGQRDEDEIGKVFKIVGRVQYEVSKSLDLYASHVNKTITVPTEGLISELRAVEGTKKQYDEKRKIFDQQRMCAGRGRLRKGKGDAQDDQELQVAKEEFDKIAGFLSNHLLSLEQDCTRSLITQAARHHAAQMQLLSRGLTSLHGIEPLMKQISQEHNIDRRLSSVDEGLFDDTDDEAGSVVDIYDDDYVSYVDDHGREHEQDLEEAGPPLDLSQEQNSLLEATVSHSQNGIYANDDSNAPGFGWREEDSRSAPISPLAVPAGVDNIEEIYIDSPDRFVSGPPPRRSPPMPSNAHRGDGSGVGAYDMLALEYYPSTSGRSPTHNLETSHLQSSIPVTAPWGQRGTTKMGVPMTMFQPFEPPPKSWPMPLPPGAGSSPVNFGAPPPSSTPKGFVSLTSTDLSQNKKRYSHSGPITSLAAPLCHSTVPSSGPIPSKVPNSESLAPFAVNHHKSGGTRSPQRPTYSSPKTSPSISPPKMSPPQINELHKLPPPPLSASSSSVPVCTPSPIAHSAPLSRPKSDHLTSTVNASPLPLPPLSDVTGRLATAGRAVKLHNQQRSQGPSITELSGVNEEALSSQQKETHTQEKQQSTGSKQNQIDSSFQGPKLQRSASGSGGPGVSRVVKFSAQDKKVRANSDFGSLDIHMRRLNTSLHSSPILATAYSVMSPTTAAVTSAKERGQAGSTFERGRWSLDGKVGGNAINSKW
ncbi:hypothetical protein CY35_16G079600 [Sphagnum magellanicum]|nr:hypothetical protein CY35_16G079600 [Sphagnum magellanicum]